MSHGSSYLIVPASKFADCALDLPARNTCWCYFQVVLLIMQPSQTDHNATLSTVEANAQCSKDHASIRISMDYSLDNCLLHTLVVSNPPVLT